MPRNLRPVEVFPITTRHLEVIRVADVTPGMRRVTIGGNQLAAHTAANGHPVAEFRSDGFDDEFKIILKHPDADEVVGPTQADGLVNWPREDPHLLMRTYTVRRWDPVAGEIDVDFVNHGVGPATTWARTVQPGEPVQVAGPKMSMGHPDGADHTIVLGDETALPAIGRWLEEWPVGARGTVLVEIGEDTHRQDLPIPDGVDLTWLSRDGAAPGTTTVLFDALQNLEWPDGVVFVWAAGEAITLVPIRRWLRGEKGLPKEQVEVTGYWRRQEPDPELIDNAERLHELGEIAPGFALRIAVTLDLPHALASQSRTGPELASALGADPVGLHKLLRYLAVLGVVVQIEGLWQLTDLGALLTDEDAIVQLDLTGPVASRELAGMLSLLAAVQTGVGDHARWFGTSYDAHEAADQQRLQRRLDRETERSVYVAGGVAAAVELPPGASITISGTAAQSFAEAIASRTPGVRTEVTAIWDPVEQVDAVLLTDVLRSLSDERAVELLRDRAAQLSPGGQVLVFAQPLDSDLAHEHTYEDDLIEYALHGGGLRRHEEHLALFAAAGLGTAQRRTIGWGWSLYTIVV